MIWDPSQGVGLEDSRWDWSPGVRSSCKSLNSKGTLLGTPNREPQEYSRNTIEYKDPGRYILGVPYLGFPVESLQIQRRGN